MEWYDGESPQFFSARFWQFVQDLEEEGRLAPKWTEDRGNEVFDRFIEVTGQANML